jgi:hypothetical protein
MSRRTRVGLTIILAVGAACAADRGFGPGSGFTHAVMTPTCGPADGPAVTIYLASVSVDPRHPPMPHIRISVWDAPAKVGGRTWRLGGSGDTASAVLVRGANDYEAATSGHVTVGVIDTTSATHGSAMLLFPTLGLVLRDFRAAWSSAAPFLCG